MQHILALSRSAVTIRHWFEINLDDASMEHGARIEIRELPPQPHRGSESASQLTTVDRPLWRADLFDRLTDPPGSFSAAHYHPQFADNEPSARFWDAALSADPWTWLGDQITSLGAAAGGVAWPLDPGDAAELPGLASTVVATAQRFGPAQCRSADECFQLTRDVQKAVQLMIATLRAPEYLDRDRAAPWLASPSGTIALRPATPADAEFCYQLHKAAMGDYVAAIWGWDEQVQRAFHARAFNPQRWQIITTGQADVGMLDVDYRPGEIYLARIEIHPGHQGHGIGTRIIGALLDEAERKGQDLVLDVLTVNRRAQALYQRLGLKEVARHGDHDTKITMRSTCHRR